MRVGILGCGYVGGAVRDVLRYAHDVRAHDPAKPALGSADAALEGADLVFACVPTPGTEDGRHDLSCLEAALADCAVWCAPGTEVVVKSTVPPGTCRSLAGRYPGIEVVHSPEFLTQRMALADFASQRRVVAGTRDGSEPPALARAVAESLPGARLQCATWEAAELLKLAVNGTGAVLVSWWNELAQVAAASGVPFGELRALVLGDGRVGPCWSEVPGPDGLPGFGGACLPKDLAALGAHARRLGVAATVAGAALEKNREVRGDR